MPDSDDRLIDDYQRLQAQADRLWDIAESIYEAARLPNVDLDYVRSASSFWQVLAHVCEAGRAAGGGLGGRRRRREQLLRAEMGLPAKDVSAQPAASPEPAVSPQGLSDPLLDAPWVRDFNESVAASAYLRALACIIAGEERIKLPSGWPACIALPVMGVAKTVLAYLAEDVIRGDLHVPEGRDAFLARFVQAFLKISPKRESSLPEGQDALQALEDALQALKDSAEEAVLKGIWKTQAQNPLAYIRLVTIIGARKHSGSRSIRSEISLDAETPAGTPFEALIQDRAALQEFDDAVTDIDVERGLSALCADLADVLRRQREEEDISFRALATKLGLPLQKYERLRKQRQRMDAELRRRLIG